MATTTPPMQESLGIPSSPAGVFGQPTIDPNATPFTPLSLPDVTPRQVSQALPQQQPVRDLGAVSHGGAIAYMADQMLRGAVQGMDAAQAQKAAQFNKKLSAQQSLYNDQANQLYQLAKSGVDPNSQEYKDAYNRTLVAWQGVMNTVGERMPQDNGKKSKKDKGNVLARIFNHGSDPNDALSAVYEAAIKTGPPVFHQIQPFLNPAYQQKQQTAARTEATTAQTAQTSADTASVTEGMKNELATLQAKQNPTDAEKARIDHLRDALSNIGKGILTPIDKVPFKNSMTGQYEQRFMDRETNQVVTEPVPGYTPAVSGKPRVQWFRDAHGKIGSVQMGADNQPDWSTANYDTLPPTGIINLFGSKEHTSNVGFTDSNGNRHEVTMLNQSREVIPPGTIPTANATPTTPSPAPPEGSSSPLPSQPKGALNQYANPEDQPPDVSYSFNKQWAKSGPYVTKLSPQDEVEFQKWAAQHPETQFELKAGDKADYDVRGWWLANKNGDPDARPNKNTWDGKMHTSDKWKTPYNGTFSNESIYAKPNAPKWVGDRLETEDGRVVTDETPRKQSHPATLHAPRTAAHPSSNGVMRDTVIGNVGSVAFKNLTKQATDAQKNFNDAATNLKTMLSTAKAAQQGNGPAQVGILSAYLKSVVGGAGSGVRINQAEWKAAQGTRPFLQGIQAKFNPHTGLMTGVTLSPSQVDQMVKEVQAKTVALHSTAQDAKKAAEAQRQKDMQAGDLIHVNPEQTFDWNAHPVVK